MARSAVERLADILAAADAIITFTAGHSRTSYGADLLLRSAVERQLLILGEAVRRLEALDGTSAARISEHRRIIGLRNIMAHGYDAVDDDVVWQVVTQKLPLLRAEARAWLAEIDTA